MNDSMIDVARTVVDSRSGRRGQGLAGCRRSLRTGPPTTNDFQGRSEGRTAMVVKPEEPDPLPDERPDAPQPVPTARTRPGRSAAAPVLVRRGHLHRLFTRVVPEQPRPLLLRLDDRRKLQPRLPGSADQPLLRRPGRPRAGPCPSRAGSGWGALLLFVALAGATGHDTAADPVLGRYRLPDRAGRACSHCSAERRPCGGTGSAFSS